MVVSYASAVVVVAAVASSTCAAFVVAPVSRSHRHHPVSVPASRRRAPSVRLAGAESSAESPLPPWGESLDPSASLLYMQFWKHQQSVLENELGARRVALPAKELEYAANERMGARIASACYETDDFRKIRMTYFDAGKKVQVFNSLWYPREELDAPVLGIDLLCFGEKKVLAVIDCQPLLPKGDREFRENTDKNFARIRANYPSLCGKMSNRYYDENTFFSDAMLFGRFDTHGPIEDEVLPAFREYMGAYLAMIRGTKPTDDRERVVGQQRAYDQYSAEHDPAHGLFVTYFGESWADEYVHDFLFDLSEKPARDEAAGGGVAADGPVVVSGRR
mmetsp:Transcript_40306/g.92540  ORF Transcript_40306/g.92540 Transcript_40306/m.92540 type:complete len:334 (+) Transcript_40306:207-1208(+)